MADEEKIAHLGFIQGVINRMGNNSFVIKGWTIALVAAIFALSSKDSNANFIFIATVPIVLFWMLDSYYLYQEKLFRGLYKEVANGSIGSNFFTMSTDEIKKKTSPMMFFLFTVSVFPFYLLIGGLLVFLATKLGIHVDYTFIKKHL
jgi:hypothetical protein